MQTEKLYIIIFLKIKKKITEYFNSRKSNKTYCLNSNLSVILFKFEKKWLTFYSHENGLCYYYILIIRRPISILFQKYKA